MKVNNNKKAITFHGEEPNESLVVCYDNRGEPYRQGATFELKCGDDYRSVFLENRELHDLRQLLDNLLNK